MNKQNKFIFNYINKYKFQFIMLLIGVVFSSFMGLMYPLITAQVINVAFYDENLSGLVNYFLLYTFVFLLHQCFHYVRTFFAAKLRTSFLVSIKTDLFKQILSMKGKSYSDYLSGDFILRLGTDVDEILNYVYFNIFYTIADIIEFIVQLIFIAILSPPFFFLTLISMPFSFFLTNYFIKKAEVLYAEQKLQRASLSSWLFEIIKGLQEIRNLGGLNSILHLFHRKNDKLSDSYRKVSHSEMKNNQIVQGVSLIIQIFLYVISAFLIINGHLLIGTFLAIVEYFNASITIFSDIAKKGNPLASGKAAIDRILEVYQLEKENYTDGNYTEADNLKINFVNCDFSYHSKTVLNQCSFSVNIGEKIAIVGANGSGKSTLVQLLLRLYDLDNGSIYLGGVEIEDYNITTLRKQIGIVFQNVLLFENTLRYNLLLSNEKEKDDLIWDNLERVGLFDFVKELPDQLDAIIGKEGISFSGGQRQRLGIARLLIKDPCILIFDESTASLDRESESIIKNTWKTMEKEKTIIIIAHKLNTIKDMERIVMLEQGKVAGIGKHEELLKGCLPYAKLFLKQSDNVEKESKL